MRLIVPIAALFVLTACDVDSDPENEQVTVTYDKERIKKTAADTARTAQEVGSSVGNVAESTGKAIKKEVGDVDVDVSVRRTRNEESIPE
jgi:hypothetical protein